MVNGQVKTPDRAAALQGETTYTMIQKAIDKVVMDNARKASKPNTAAATTTKTDPQATGPEAGDPEAGDPEEYRKAAAKATPTAATPTGTAGVTMNFTINGVKEQVRVQDDASATALQNVLRGLGAAATRAS